MIHRLAVYLLFAGCLTFGAILFSELFLAGADEVSISRPQTRPATAPTVAGRKTARSDELVATVLARPLFSNTRRPPQVASTDAADEEFSGTRLTGIVTESGRRIAVFAISGAKSLRVAEGEAVNGWRVESIMPREVSLSGPNGTKMLRPTFDTNLKPAHGPEAAVAGNVRQPVPATATGAVKTGAPPSAPTPAGIAGQIIPPHVIPPITSPGMPLPRTGRMGVR